MAQRGRHRQKKKGGGIGNVISTLIIIVALGVFCFAGYKLIMIYLDYKVGTDEYRQIEEMAVDETRITEGFDASNMVDNNTMGDVWGDAVLDEDAAGVKYEEMENPIDFDSLLAINTDVIGWIEMEALDISYPIAQGGDNNYYLHRTIQKTDNFAGSIFLDFQNHSNFGDRNSVIYGHNMKNGSMFGTLRKYCEQDTWDKSRYFWIYTPDYIYKYEIFSCAEVDKYSDDYQITFSSREEFEAFLERAKGQSAIQNDTEVGYDDTIITLSTCTGNDATRFIVQAKRVRTYKAVPKVGGYEQETGNEGISAE